MLKLKRISLVLCFFAIFSCGGSGESTDGSVAVQAPAFVKLNIIGETSLNGIFDPSIEYESDGNTGWLVYTAIEVPRMNTHLAKSTDHGETWTFVKAVNSFFETTITLNSQNIDGQWINEVPSLVYDPDDPGREWKLFSHKYFVKKPYSSYEENRIIQTMYIAYKYAHTPEELDAAEEFILFGAGGSPVVPGPAKYDLNSFDPGLSQTILYSEPGVFYKNGVLYMSLSAVAADTEDHKMILLSSSDHSENWELIKILTDNLDAAFFDAAVFTASSIVEEKGRIFLLFAPVVQDGDTGRHNGTYIVEFTDISVGQLKRNIEGRLVIHKYLAPSLDSPNSGESDYDKYNSKGGIIFSQKNDAEFPEVFQVYNTKRKIID